MTHNDHVVVRGTYTYKSVRISFLQLPTSPPVLLLVIPTLASLPSLLPSEGGTGVKGVLCRCSSRKPSPQTFPMATAAPPEPANAPPPPFVQKREKVSLGPDSYPRAVLVFVLLINAGAVACFFQAASLLFVRPFSRAAHRRVSVVFNSAFFLCGVFLLEVWTGIRIVTYGEEVPKESPAVCVMNHISDVDMLIGVSLLSRYGSPYPGNAKAIVKSALATVPIFGWILWFGEYLFVTRSWEADRVRLLADLKSLLTFPFPVWFVLWPEGSRFTPAKLANSQEYARKMGMPHLEHVLLPRMKAFLSVLDVVRSGVEDLCDVTLMFEGPIPSAKHILFGRCPTIIHAHLGRYKISDMPTDDAGLESWLVQVWKEKDDRIERFENEGPQSLGAPCTTGAFANSAEKLPSIASLYLMIATGLAVCFLSLWFSYENKFVFRLLLGGPPIALLVAAIFLALAIRTSSKGLPPGARASRRRKSD